MIFTFIALTYMAFPETIYSSAPCIERADISSNTLVQISPCHAEYHHPNSSTASLPDGDSTSTYSTTPKLPDIVTRFHGFPAIFAGTNVYVSTNRFRDQPHCVTEDLLPADITSSRLTGAGFSDNFLHLLFGRQVVRVRTSQLARWLAGDRSARVLDVRQLPTRRRADAPPASHLITSPCCDVSKWCADANSHVVAYSLGVSDTGLMLDISWDEGVSYHRQAVAVPAGGRPLLFAQYPSEEYGSLFFNHAGKGLVVRVPHECHQLPAGSGAGDRDGPACRPQPLQVADQPLGHVALEPTMRMLTVIVTEDNRLLVSGRADTNFERATVLDAATLKELGAGAAASLPIRAFATDGDRWMLIDADDYVLLGGGLDIWTVRATRLRLGQAGGGSGGATPSSTPPPPSNASAAGKGRSAAAAATEQHRAFTLHGRTVEVLSLSESAGALTAAARRVSLAPQLARLDAQCEVYQLSAVSRSRSEPMVDKSDTLLLDVQLSAAARLAVRPLVLISSQMLVSETRLLASRTRTDGAVTSDWLVAVRSHPQNRRRPFMPQLQLAQLYVTSTVAQAECPARRPRAFPVLVGCNPWLRLVARNKRVDAASCRQLQEMELRVPSTPEREPLLRYQQRVRGERAVRREGGEWRVRWDPAWGCPLMSSDKAQFTPVLAVKAGDRLRPLQQATALFEIHGVHDFNFGLTLADVGCRHNDHAEAVSWYRTYSGVLERGNISADFDPSTVLNTASYVSCNHTGRLPARYVPSAEMADQPLTNISFELFGVPGHNNSILWAESAKIHVFNFRVVDPLFTYCDLSLTVPVFFMHSSDVKQETKMSILLVGVGLSLLAVLVAHLSHQVTRRLRRDKQAHLDQLLTAADTFAGITAEQKPQLQDQ